jgi:hypothetical protein
MFLFNSPKEKTPVRMPKATPTDRARLLTRERERERGRERERERERDAEIQRERGGFNFVLSILYTHGNSS